MTTRFKCTIAALLMSMSCSDPDSKPDNDATQADVGGSFDTGASDDVASPTDDGPAIDASQPDLPGDLSNLTATWRGDFTAAVADEGTVLWLEVIMTHEGSTVSGTFTSENSRAGTLTGVVDGSTITSDVVYTDSCSGTATSTMEVTPDGTRLVGTYVSTDCFGEYDGTMDLLRQP